VTSKDLPISVYSLVRIFAVDQHHDVVNANDSSLSADTREVAFAWDWSFREPGEFEVLLGAEIGPNKDVPETIKYAVVAHFRFDDERTADQVTQFAYRNAPTILIPYLREGISALSGRGPYGAFILPPLNMTEVIKSFNPEGASGIAELEAQPQMLRPERAAIPPADE
jgi:preprotein translocase subunit SecB